jgi:hypothetical protein
VIKRSVISASGIDRAGYHATELVKQFHRTLVLAALIGIVTGVGVAGFDWCVDRVLTVVERQGVVWTAVVPAAGLLPALLAAAAAQLVMGGRSFSPHQHRERPAGR